MDSQTLRQKFLDFFKQKGHTIIPSASLVPENDPTVLFTTAGMHPLVPYLMGEKHPGGKRVANVQKCIRTDDIDEVGDKVHHTFFEMLGNWSFGDYFKDEAIEWSYEFLTKELGVDLGKFAVSVFSGDQDAPFDQASYDKWISLGIPAERIAKLPKKNNWWGPAGQTGPCGPDTEMFIWTGDSPAPKNFQETCDDPNWVEVWNDVFMQYIKTADSKFGPLTQKNVDTGMGLERMLAVINDLDDNYQTELFSEIITQIERSTNKKYQENQKAFRIIADHVKAATFLSSEGIYPSNTDRGYVMRKLIRRAIRYGKQINLNSIVPIVSAVIHTYSATYPELGHDQIIINRIAEEEAKFAKTLEEGLKKAESLFKTKTPIDKQHYSKIMQIDDKKGILKMIHRGTNQENILPSLGIPIDNQTILNAYISGKEAFDLFQSYGFPIEMIIDLVQEKGLFVSISEFREELARHQDLSRTASAGMFKGGLADGGDQVIKYHTATHLLLAALRKVLGDHVLQRGSNITAERLRFDFSHPDKLTPEQIKSAEDLVNEQIQKNLPVHLEEMSLEDAKKAGAMGVFESKYGEKVKVYTIGESTTSYFSKEICGGPHVKNTSELGHFKIQKEESSSAGIRRIKAVLT